MQSALESAIGLPRRSTRALRMLAFLTPADVRRSLKDASDVSAMERSRYGPGLSAGLIARVVRWTREPRSGPRSPPTGYLDQRSLRPAGGRSHAAISRR